jgi:hypothetical protein
MEPMYVGSDGSSFVGFAVVAVAVLLLVLGNVILHRITHPDETPDHWRSHRH